MDDLERLMGPWLLDDVPAGHDAWPAVRSWVADARNDVLVVPADDLDGERALWELGLTETAVLGAIALHAAAILVDHGWVRVHGARLLTRSTLDPRQGLLIAHDAIGGQFALDAGGITGVAGEVVYRPPGGLEWQSMDRTHEDWLRWLLGEDLGPFYGDVRWPGWEREVLALPLGDVLRLSPPPFTGEAWDAAAARRERVPGHGALSLAPA